MAIKKSWDCNCTKPHIAGLGLQKRLTGNDSDSSIAFNIPEEVQKPSNHSREIVIAIKKDKSKESTKTPQKSSLSPGALLAQGEYLGKLRRNFKIKFTQLNVMSRSSLRASLSASSSPSLQAPLRDVSSGA
jgi:hypothetical protein